MLLNIPFVLMDSDGWHMMDWNHHMMDWWGVPLIGYWWIGIWIAQSIIAFIVYRDAENRENNGLLWFILVFIPWVGIFFLIMYLIIREDKAEMKETMSDAQKVLDERYTEGEITRKEYIQAKEDIEKKELK